MTERKDKVRALVLALVAGALGALALLPLGQTGSCPSGGRCVIQTTNAFMVPVPSWLWVPASLACGLLTWTTSRRRSIHRARAARATVGADG